MRYLIDIASFFTQRVDRETNRIPKSDSGDKRISRARGFDAKGQLFDDNRGALAPPLAACGNRLEIVAR